MKPTWTGSSFETTVDRSWKNGHGPPDEYSLSGDVHISLNSTFDVSTQRLSSVIFSQQSSGSYSATHASSAYNTKRDLSAHGIMYTGSTADTMFFYISLFLDPDRLDSAYHYDDNIDYYRGQRTTTESKCLVRATSSNQGFIRIKFYK
jgi:hypothetical protein